jgi:hypothetical protein
LWESILFILIGKHSKSEKSFFLATKVQNVNHRGLRRELSRTERRNEVNLGMNSEKIKGSSSKIEASKNTACAVG